MQQFKLDHLTFLLQLFIETWKKIAVCLPLKEYIFTNEGALTKFMEGVKPSLLLALSCLLLLWPSQSVELWNDKKVLKVTGIYNGDFKNTGDIGYIMMYGTALFNKGCKLFTSMLFLNSRQIIIIKNNLKQYSHRINSFFQI